MSTYQQPGRGYRPLALAADPVLGALVEQRAPVTLRQYVAPLGNGWHLIRRDCNEAPYEASSSTGATFREGETVAVVGEAGLRGEIIIGPAATATADYPTVPLSLNLSLDIPPPPAEPEPECPGPLLGRTYLGVYDDTDNELLYCYNYNDGTYVSTLAIFDYGATPLFSLRSFQRVHSSGDILVFTASGGSGVDINVCTWDLAANTVARAACNSPVMFVQTASQAVWAGGTDVYFFLEGSPFGPPAPRYLQLYKVAVGATTWDEAATAIGGVLTPTGYPGLAVGPQLLHAGTGGFHVPSLNYSVEPINGEEAVPFFTGGVWAEGLDRRSFANDGSMGSGYDGYEVAGNRAIRITFGPGAVPPAVLGLMSTTGSETSLLPAEWVLAALYNLSVAPSKNEVAVFADPDGGTLDQLLRLNVNVIPGLGSCPLPLITVEPSPDGFVPAYMLCRDH